MASVQATLAKPGVATAALNYYRHTFNPPPNAPAQAQSAAIQQITVPTLYIHGQEDDCIGVELAEGMEAFFDNGLEKVVVDNAGHFVHQERPDEVNRLILEFLE